MIYRGPRKAHGRISYAAPIGAVILMLLLCPTVDLLAIGFNYTSCFTLNDIQSQRAANLPAQQATDPNGLVRKTLPSDWRNDGLGAYVDLVQQPKTEVTFADRGAVTPATSGTQNEQAEATVTERSLRAREFPSFSDTTSYVTVKTTIVARPLLPLPISLPLPGLTEPLTYTVTNRRCLAPGHFANGATSAHPA